MKKHDYWVYKNQFTHNQLELMGEVALTRGRLEDSKDQCDGKDTESYWTNALQEVPFLSEFKDHCIHEVKDNFGYDIDASYTKEFLLNIYHEGSNGYPWHVDGHQLPYNDIKMTCIINASLEPYRGGSLYLAAARLPDEPVPELEQPGNVIVFRSNILHKVSPILIGQRRSLVMFFSGPNWR